MVPFASAATASRPSPLIPTAQAAAGTGTDQTSSPWTPKRRRYQSVPSTKDLRSGAIATLREVSFFSRASDFPENLGATSFRQSRNGRLTVSAGRISLGEFRVLSLRAPASNQAGLPPPFSRPKATRDPSVDNRSARSALGNQRYRMGVAAPASARRHIGRRSDLQSHKQSRLRPTGRCP